jgi:flagellar biosynthesis/type III secretory pathway protein FliH
LQQQKRMSQYRIQEEYLEHLRQQQVFLQNDRHPDYDRDPYFYTAPIYRYHRGGHYYEINQYGADLLRQALNNGYQEGFRAGRADREDRWRSNYRDSYAYQDANYGYNGYYVDQDDYNYYFREGFRRGYEDGYNSRYQYGRYSNGSYSMLDVILSQVLGFQSLR